jgi:hypothetical protein
MTALGAALYGGFFALAALWLFVTADSQDQEPDRSNPANRAEASDGSMPMLVSHSSLK